jgi:CubicO group peptidase (beta-lactamase class C family)
MIFVPIYVTLQKTIKGTVAMNKRFFYLFSLTVLLSILTSSLTGLAQEQKFKDDVKTRIKLVENNLCSVLQVEGQPNWALEDRMKFYHTNGVTIAVIKNFKVDWAKGYGWADVAERRPVTTSTLFQAGSMSKSLNGVGVLKFVQEGKLNLYEDINKYLKSWKFPYDSTSHGGKITIANLLSHTAGLTVHGFPGYEKGDTIPTLPQILNGVHPANTPAVVSAFKPSLRTEYSGGGTIISQLILQDITNLSYDKIMWENVLKPLGMMNSSFMQPPPANKEKQLATGYYVDGKEVKGKYHIYPEQAAAGLWTTPADLAKYIIEIQLSLLGKSNKVLSQTMTKLMLTPYLNKTLALGVFIDTIGEKVYFSHGGQDRGFSGSYFGSLDGNGVVVMANTDAGYIVNEIINSVAVVYKWRDFYKPFMTLKKMVLDNAVLETYVGQYQNTTVSKGQYNLTAGSIFTITKDGHQLKAQAEGQEVIDIYPVSESMFFPKTSDTDIQFIKDGKGIVTKLIIHQNGKYIECNKIK